jgi:hypothetical protein
MEKFKKVAIRIGIVALIVGSIAVSVCLFVIPTETKAFFEELWVAVNQPLPIAGFSAITFAFALIKIFSMSSWGKKALRKLEESWGKWRTQVDEEKSREEELVKENKETRAETELMLQSFSGNIEGLAKLLYEALKTSPNKKMNALADKVLEICPLTLEEAQKEVAEKDININSLQPKEITDAENMGLVGDIDKESVQNG